METYWTLKGGMRGARLWGHDVDDPIERRRRQRDAQFNRRLIGLTILGACLFIATGAVIVGVILSKKAGTASEPSARETPPNRPQPASSPSYYLSLNETNPFSQVKGLPSLNIGAFQQDFDVNELKASKDYVGQRFLIAGRVDQLSVHKTETASDTMLTLGRPGFWSVICTCPSSDPLLLKIRAGDVIGADSDQHASVVLVEGICKGRNTFDECRVIAIR